MSWRGTYDRDPGRIFGPPQVERLNVQSFPNFVADPLCGGPGDLLVQFPGDRLLAAWSLPRADPGRLQPVFPDPRVTRTRL